MYSEGGPWTEDQTIALFDIVGERKSDTSKDTDNDWDVMACSVPSLLSLLELLPCKFQGVQFSGQVAFASGRNDPGRHR
jgi:hypothetical protein